MNVRMCRNISADYERRAFTPFGSLGGRRPANWSLLPPRSRTILIIQKLEASGFGMYSNTFHSVLMILVCRNRDRHHHDFRRIQQPESVDGIWIFPVNNDHAGTQDSPNSHLLNFLLASFGVPLPIVTARIE